MMRNDKNIRRRIAGMALVAGAALSLGACGNTAADQQAGAPVALTGNQSKPIALIRPDSSSFGGSVTMAAPENVARAVDRHRINLKKAEAPYQTHGADLDGDGRAEALAYMTGEDWCVKTGCTLLVLRQGARDVQVISSVLRVKPPVVIAATPTNGWRDLFVSSGGAGMRLQTVRLRFDGASYPDNASVLKPFLGDARANGETVFAQTAPRNAQASAEPDNGPRIIQ